MLVLLTEVFIFDTQTFLTETSTTAH